jgi:hypothetical protein
MGVSKTVYPGWLQTSIIPILASQVAGITGMSHQARLFYFIYSFIFLFFSFVVQGLELRAYTLSHTTSSFCVSIFETGSCELFAQAKSL